MDDLISRQAAIDAMAELQGRASTKAELKGISKAWKRIKELQPIQPEPHWIPVEQELPKIGEYVLCGTKAQYFGKYHVCKFVDKDKWIDKPHFDWDRNGFPHVVAWTRFEPYKGVTDGRD